METLKNVISNPSGMDSLSNYIGELPENNWMCVLTQSRDSSCLERSNFNSALRLLGGESDSVRIDRFGHWACGWWESLSVDVNSKEYKIALEIEESIKDYPIVDEDDYSNMEREEANEIWKNCYNKRERIEYIRENRSQFDFYSFSEVLSVVSGEYFNGYASELIN